ncbi:putative reverse transcriptase domain-containing protein [Tanacetum coccineum]
MEITTTTMGMVGTMGVPTRDFRHMALGSMTKREVKYAASSFVKKALIRWNTQIQARGREAAIGMTWNDFKALLVEEFCPSNEMERYVVGLAPEIMGMLKATQPTTIQNAIPRAGILTDEAISCGTLSKSNKKRKAVEEDAKSGGSWRDKKKAKGGAGCVLTARGLAILLESVGHHLSEQLWLNRAPGQEGNPLALEGNHNNRNNRNQTWGKAYNVNVNAAETSRDPKVVTGTFSLNDYFATVLFDSRADFSFISTEFVSLLNVKPSIANPSYVIEIADGKKVEVNRIIRGCKLELGNSLFTIDLIPLGHGSFDVIVGMDWLSQNKPMIVYHEKVVEIPLIGGEILMVQGEAAFE